MLAVGQVLTAFHLNSCVASRCSCFEPEDLLGFLNHSVSAGSVLYNPAGVLSQLEKGEIGGASGFLVRHVLVLQ